jgi:hypothetical protein
LPRTALTSPQELQSPATRHDRNIRHITEHEAKIERSKVFNNPKCVNAVAGIGWCWSIVVFFTCGCGSFKKAKAD